MKWCCWVSCCCCCSGVSVDTEDDRQSGSKSYNLRDRCPKTILYEAPVVGVFSHTCTTLTTIFYMCVVNSEHLASCCYCPVSYYLLCVVCVSCLHTSWLALFMFNLSFLVVWVLYSLGRLLQLLRPNVHPPARPSIHEKLFQCERNLICK